MNWRQWTGLYKSKGYKLEAMEEVLKGRPGFSRNTLSKLSKSREPADPELVALVWGLEIRPGAEDDFGVYWRGLASLGVDVPAPLLAELASAPRSGTDAKAITAGLALKLDAILGTLGGKLDGVASAIESLASPLRGKLDAATSTLDSVAATLNDVDAKVDLAEFRRADDTRRIIRAVWGSSALAVLVAVVLVHRQLGPTAAPSTAPVYHVMVNVGAGQGAAQEATSGLLIDWLGGQVRLYADGAMGKRKVQRPVPRTPLPGQAVVPCQGSETTLYGSCWLKIADRHAPCPPDLFEEGDNCYAPSMMAPKRPESETSRLPDAEPR